MMKDKMYNGHKGNTPNQSGLTEVCPSQMKCPYCGQEMQLRSADGIGIYKHNPHQKRLYVCANYPKCKTYVGVKDGTFEPLGTPANGQLRDLRRRAHDELEKLWTQKIMTRNEVYRWLAKITGLSRQDTQIGYLREQMCRLVIKKSKELIEKVSQDKSIE